MRGAELETFEAAPAPNLTRKALATRISRVSAGGRLGIEDAEGTRIRVRTIGYGDMMEHQRNGAQEGRTVLHQKAQTPVKSIARVCEMCHEIYTARSRFSRFCKTCKAENERYKYAEWLPLGTMN